ncbi:MAG TPA: outer membrane protein assembly factor BamE [Luteimonas sp.]
MHKLIVTALAACLTAGCGITYKQPIYQGTLISPANVEQLQVGMNRQQVEALLGTPSIQDPFHHDRWDYTATERVGRSGRTEQRNFVVHFEGDAVVRWEGDYFPERNQELIQDVRQQFGPNLPRQNNNRRGGR